MFKGGVIKCEQVSMYLTVCQTNLASSLGSSLSLYVFYKFIYSDIGMTFKNFI